MVITPALLQRNDVFQRDGLTYKVKKLASNYAYIYPVGGNGTCSQIDIRSKEILWLLLDGDFYCPPHELKNHFKILPETLETPPYLLT